MNAKNNSAENVYIQSATLNGKPLNRPVVSYDQILAGGTLDFVMGPKPSRWAAGRLGGWAAGWRPQPLTP